MASTIKFEDLLKEYGLTEEDCCRQVCKKGVDKISISCSLPYERLPAYLDLKGVSAKDIRKDCKSEPERRTALLEAWKQMKGSDATYKALIVALLEIGHRDDAEEICKLTPKASKLVTLATTSVHTQVQLTSGN